MLDSIRALVKDGFAVHLLHPRSKAPLLDGWSKAKVATFEDLRRAYRPGMNVGVRLGEPSRVNGRYLHAIDLDVRDPKAEKEARAALYGLFGKVAGRMWKVKSGSAGPSFHYYFLSDTHFPSQNLARSDDFIDIEGQRRRAWEIDFLGTGKQAALPPSIHPDTGRPYEWVIEPNDFPITIHSDTLGDILEPDDYESPDNADPMGLDLDEAAAILETLKGQADDHATWVKVGMALKHEFGDDAWSLFDKWSQQGRGYDRSGNLYQWERFKNDRRKVITMRSLAAEAREIEKAEDLEALWDDLDVEPPSKRKKAPAAPATAHKRDPNMTILDATDNSDGEPINPFPLEIFPPRLAKKIRKTSKDMTVPVDFVVAAMLAAVSTAIGNRRRVRVNGTYSQPLVLWIQAVGSPSMKKSPAISMFKKALSGIEARYYEGYKQALKEWENARTVADIKRKGWEAMFKAMVAEGKDPPQQPPAGSEAPPRPMRRDLLVGDTTPEALASLLAINPLGVGLFSDELSHWLKGLVRYNGESRGYWLSIYDAESEKRHRVKDGEDTKVASFPFVSIVGAIQPDKLLEITAQDTADDGMQSRFMPFWPDYTFLPMSGENVKPTEWPVPILDNLVTLLPTAAGEPVEMPFTDAARRRLAEWSNERERAERGIGDRLEGILGKASGQVVRMAGILELLAWADECDDFDPIDPPTKISLDAVEKAIHFRTAYLKPMQSRVYGHSLESDEMHNARAIANWIVLNRAEIINTRELRRGAGVRGMGKGHDADILDAAIDQLVSFGWVIVEKRESKSGRPRRDFVVNPRVWELLDAES